jgi:hypothetical protein
VSFEITQFLEYIALILSWGLTFILLSGRWGQPRMRAASVTVTAGVCDLPLREFKRDRELY